MPSKNSRLKIAAVSRIAGVRSELLNSKFLREVDRQCELLDELEVEWPALVIIQNAPDGFCPDGRALPEQSDTRKLTKDKWKIGERELEANFWFNALRHD